MTSCWIGRSEIDFGKKPRQSMKPKTNTVEVKRSRNYLFTDFKNLTNEYWHELYSANKYTIRFLFGGHEECPTTKKKHIQGWIQFEKPQRFTAVKKILKGANFRVCKGTEQHNMDYCAKSGDTFKYGEYQVQGMKQGISSAYQMLKDGADMLDVAEKFPGMYLKYHNAFDKVARMYRQRQAKDSLKDWAQSKKLKKWQKEALQELKNQSDREVLWIVGRSGNEGKSFLAKHIIGTDNAFYVRNGKSGDIAYSYEYQKTVVFDFVRSQEERINYGIIEAFKDGMLFSPKYESITKIFKPTKVIVFSNFHPNKSELSADRWNIMEI